VFYRITVDFYRKIAIIMNEAVINYWSSDENTYIAVI
jgi:hypothetical protein